MTMLTTSTPSVAYHQAYAHHTPVTCTRDAIVILHTELCCSSFSWTLAQTAVIPAPEGDGGGGGGGVSLVAGHQVSESRSP